MHCPICFSEKVRVRGRDLWTCENHFMRCSECGHGFCSLSTTGQQLEAFNKKAFFGEDDSPDIPEGFQINDQVSDHHARWLSEKIDAYAKGSNLLDIGCGLGGLLKYFVRNTRYVCYGNDIAPKACQYVRGHLGITAFEGAFLASLVGDTRFDVVIASHVLEHLENPHSFIREIKSVCNPGAVIAVICPHDGSLTAMLKRQVFYPARVTYEFGHLHYPMHLQGYTKKSMTELFVSEGYTPLECVTLSKAQKAYGYNFKGWRERVMFPLYLLESLTDSGNFICCFFSVGQQS